MSKQQERAFNMLLFAWVVIVAIVVVGIVFAGCCGH